MERRDVSYRGRVQGVGFRYTTCRIATGYRVAGFVANRPDGSVHLIAEGEADELDRFLEEIARVMQDYIRDAQVDRQAATGEFSSSGFEIKG